nr:hypothetical protein [Shewanella shenzhenensis]
QPAFLLESFVADSPHSLNDDAIWSIYADDHQLWFGGVGQMHRFDQNTHEMVHVAPQDILPDDSIFDMEAFDDRHLLVATVDGIRLVDVA